jgi:hypothetical protein
MSRLPHDGERRDLGSAFSPLNRSPPGRRQRTVAARLGEAAAQPAGMMHPAGSIFGKPKEAVGRWVPDDALAAPAERPGAPHTFTPIHELVLDGREQELVDELCRVERAHGGRERLAQLLASEDDGGCTPLMRAAFDGSVSTVRALLAMGADANAVSARTQRTALHEAASGTHDNPAVSGLLLGAGTDPEVRALVNGRTALDITRLKIGPDGHVGSSAITAQLAPLVRESLYRRMDRSSIQHYDAEVAALRHIVEVVGLAKGLAKHAELMAAVDELHVDLHAMIQRDGVEGGVATCFEHAEAVARARVEASAPSHAAASLLPGTVIFVVGKGRGVYKGGASQLSAAEMAGSGEFGTHREANHSVEFASGITQQVQLDKTEWSRVNDLPKRAGPVRRDPVRQPVPSSERSGHYPANDSSSSSSSSSAHGTSSGSGPPMMGSSRVSDSLDEFREVSSSMVSPRRVQVQTTPRTYVYEHTRHEISR